MLMMHTSDWHVGASLRGRSRLDEQRAVLAEMVDIAAEEGVDLVVVAGDLFESSAPTGEMEEVAWRALLDLGRVADVLVVAGNHDDARRLAAVAPLLALGRVTVASQVRAPDAGGVIELEAGGTPVRAALVPFVSQRGVVRAAELMAAEASDHAQTFAHRMTRVLGALTADFDVDAVNLVVAHALVADGVLGGGERSAHTVEQYAIPRTAFPPSASYVALGHLHRSQSLAGPCPLHYCGSPLALDFSEGDDPKGVKLVELAPGRPARVTERILTSSRRLRTLSGTLDQLAALADQVDPDAWLRVRVNEAHRAGLADQVRALLPGALDVTIVPPDQPHALRPSRRRAGTTPTELFREFCADNQIDDPRLGALFADLLDEVSSS